MARSNHAENPQRRRANLHGVPTQSRGMDGIGRAVIEQLATLLIHRRDSASVSGKELDVSASDVAPVLLA